MRKAVLAVFLLSFGISLHAQEVTLRHALSARNLDTLSTLVVRFNAAQKGKGKVVLQDIKSANDGRHLPHMALLDSDDSITFFGTLPRFKPLYQAMKESGVPLDAAGMYPQIAEAMSEKPGQLQALPLGLSLPVIYWNKELFRKAGLAPDTAPRTWHEVQTAAGALNDAGIACPLTSSRFSWVHLENVTTQQGQPIFGQSNRVALNGLINVKHMAMLASWYRSSYFRYYGARSEADARFLSGECAMLTGESSLYADIYAAGRIKAGVGSLPYYEDEYGVTPGNVVPDGAGLWILAGKSKEEYKLMARFVAFLMQPEVQRDWVKGTGYLPMTAQAIAALRESGAPPAVLDAAARRLSIRSDKPRLKSGALLTRLRDNIGEQIELVWRDKISAKQALDVAMQRVNAIAIKQ
ncbi:extracellular solute-binding protein [Georgfuchsia toluolica]|nr:extracellular solute-binding protein [Georgfuchsia toluolica]